VGVVSSCARYIVHVQVSLQVTEFGDWLQIIVCSKNGEHGGFLTVQ